MKPFLVAVLAALAVPGVARAEPASILSRDVPLRAEGGRTLAAAARFNLVGLHWQGPGSVEFRTRSLTGRWSAWRPAAPEDEDRPDPAARERSRPGWRLGNPYWTGASDRLEARASGLVRRVRAHYVWSPVEGAAAPARSLAVAEEPPIVPRLSWGANELIKRGTPSYAASLQLAVVHHTAGTNAYTAAQSAAIVRGIQLYHVRGNGWNDIGYNFLVDKFGQIFEGRFGGIEANVVGAHAQGFNTGSTGVALLGNYNGGGITAAGRAALVELLAWRLDVAHVDPLRTLTALSGGNPRFPSGVPVFLRGISGHRDTGFTDCPGARLYATLDSLARDVGRTGLPKIYEPVVAGAPGGPVRFTARLSSPLPWTLTVLDAAGKPVAAGTGAGAAVDWTWDATAAAPGAYTYTLDAAGTRAATGQLGQRNATLTLTQVKAQPSAVTPNGDGRDDSTVISYRLGAPATVTATLTDASGRALSTLFSEPRSAGPQSFVFTGEGIADGNYRIALVAVGTSGRQVSARVSVLVNRTLSAFAAMRKVFSPNADGRADRIDFSFALASPAQVRLRVLRGGKWVATPFTGPLAPGPQKLTWDGAKRVGRALDGGYEAEITVTDVVGSVSQRVPFTLDTRPPVLRLVSLRPLVLDVSEPAAVVLTVNGARRVVKRTKPGRFAVGLPFRARAVRGIAWDPGGNRSRPLRYP
jgi:N-acetylmuramoyl-L-alanine amidase